ncbi:glycosyltransferase family 4 protein [Solibacillus sp. CAU 1738]|uniref:glycosyltransferase family 4 protein n=1 Tax=Solibacillus sp. CAU 1738 TaxID=3140363 RepID=UPI0032618583
MKRILWVCNVPIPKIANNMKIKVPNISGWLTGFANALEKANDVELHICFPLIGLKEMKQGKVGSLRYYAFSQPKLFGFIPVEDPLNTSVLMEKHLDEIVTLVKPDVLHIFGTEYPHALVAAKAFNKPNRTVVHIQGLTSYYWMHFNSGIPDKVKKKFSISNFARGNLLKQEKKLKQRGEFEIETLKIVGHVIGRTDWDEACTTQINPDIKYHFCNESLRDPFYDEEWNAEKCERYSIFMSQAATPIKGLHFMIRALPEIIRVYPDTHLYIAGNDLIRTDSLYAKLKISSFAIYIKALLKEFDIENKVTFTGSLNEIKMKERFLKSNVFISPSTIENSPNSLGEAMLLGVPCISSDVGGVKDMLEHNKEGFIYQGDAPYMLAYFVKKYFGNPDLARSFGLEAKKHALVTHCRENNLKTLLKIYDEIIQG